jgi:hypothetical protein
MLKAGVMQMNMQLPKIAALAPAYVAAPVFAASDVRS